MRDPRIEHWLKVEHQINFEFLEHVALTHVDAEASRANQARVDRPIIEDLVERYALAMMDGAVEAMPPLIGKRRVKDSKIVLLDGNQRYAAAVEAELEVFDMYLVPSDLDDQRTTMLCWTANSLNGDAGTPLDTMLQAKNYHHRYPNVKIKEVARLFRIKEEKLAGELRLDEVRARLSDFGLDGDLIPNIAKQHLHTLKSDVIFREAAKLVQEADLRGSIADEFWVDVKRARSEAEALEVIERWRNRPEVQQKLRNKRYHRAAPTRSKFQLALDKLNSLIRHLERYPDPTSLEVVTYEELRLFASRYKQLGPMIAGLLKAYAPDAAA